MKLCRVIIAILLGMAVPAFAQTYKGLELVQASLLTDTAAIAPGKPFTVALRLKMAPHWHTYWAYSGDAGLPTTIKWTLPDGFRAGPIQWPVPTRIDSPGDIVNYGYSDEVLLLTTITPPAQIPTGDIVLKAKADWLVCAELCIPGSQELEIKYPGADPSGASAIAEARRHLPKTEGASIVERKRVGDQLEFKVRLPLDAPGGSLEFFPLPGNAEVGHPGKVVIESAGSSSVASFSLPLTGEVANPNSIGGVLAVKSSDPAAAYELPVEETKAPVASGAAPNPAQGSLWHFLLFGFIGGLILNVMPCVLPVISLKIFSFIKQANDAPNRIFKMGLAYSSGVFVWFLGFALLVIALKAGGREVGYAFHLQNPWFIVGLSAAVFVFALNLLGVFEFILPDAAAGALTEASQRNDGYTGAFLQGVLATVLGSACTAPFFGAALGFAFAQSAPVILAVFAAIALGMSLPFLLLTAFPAWLRFLPRPGAWMERVKQATGFLMLATLLWLMSVLGAMRGADAVVWLGVLLLAVGAAAWVHGTFYTLVASTRTRIIALAVMLVLVAGGGWTGLTQIAEAKLPTGSAQDFPAQLQAALQAPGRPVFVDFTAAWCVNCKANEKAVLNTSSVQQALKDANADFLTADWTNGEPGITAILKQFGRAGVPLYVIYPADRTKQPIVLPEIITHQMVIDGLKAAAADDHKLAKAP